MFPSDALRAVVVFESMFGNTEQVAREIGDGLAGQGMQVALVDVRHVRPEDLAHRDLVVVGAPTHAFTLSRPSTRSDAVRQGAAADRATTGVREWLHAGLGAADRAFPAGSRRPLVATFDTRVDKVQHWPGSAARKAARVLRGRGFEVVEQATSFYVVDVRGPLVEGERERARAWAHRLAGLVRARSETKSA